jgi:outer membrane protein TolC
VTLNATQELLNGLDNLAYSREVYDLGELELANNKRLFELAQVRYKSGDTDFLTLLNAQRSWFNAQLALSNSYRQVLVATVDVYRAAGGVPYAVN